MKPRPTPPNLFLAIYKPTGEILSNNSATYPAFQYISQARAKITNSMKGFYTLQNKMKVDRNPDNYEIVEYTPFSLGTHPLKKPK